MSEELISPLMMEGVEIDLALFSANTLWAGTQTSASLEKAPNGAACRAFANTSSIGYSLSSLVGSVPFSLGIWQKITTYVNTSSGYANQSLVLQLGKTFNNQVLFYAGGNAGALPTYNSVSGVGYSNNYSPLNQWVHFLLAYDPATGKRRGFVNGIAFGEAVDIKPADYAQIWLGGFAARSGNYGSSSGRYPYVGLMSAVRVYPFYQMNNFSP